MRRGEETPASTARDIVRGVMEDIIGPFVQTHRRGGRDGHATERDSAR